VNGAYYVPGRPRPILACQALVAFDDPRIRWTCAAHLVRELHDCTFVDLDRMM